MTETLYMDHQATTPAEKSVLSAMSDYWEKSFGKPILESLGSGKPDFGEKRFWDKSISDNH